MESVGHFKSGRDYYDRGDWDKAVNSFQQAFTLNPKDKLTETYISRCEQLKADPPKSWNGVWVMTSK
jgi:adenylate cyclase